MDPSLYLLAFGRAGGLIVHNLYECLYDRTGYERLESANNADVFLVSG